jgi:hypothetical protein
MEEVIDFDEWLKKLEVRKPVFYVIYNSETGEINSVGPNTQCLDHQSKLEITQDFADLIFSGKINPSSLRVNYETQTIDVVEEPDSLSSNFLIHRIPEKKNFEGKDIDIFILYDRSNKELVFEMTEKFGGTYNNSQCIKTEKKQPFWDKELTVEYTVGDYNDPNVIHESIEIKLSDMIGKKVTFENIFLPKKYSIFYTKRILRNHVTEEL